VLFTHDASANQSTKEALPLSYAREEASEPRALLLERSLHHLIPRDKRHPPVERGFVVCPIYPLGSL
jgi:hypothetical protein